MEWKEWIMVLYEGASIKGVLSESETIEQEFYSFIFCVKAVNVHAVITYIILLFSPVSRCFLTPTDITFIHNIVHACIL